MNFEDFIIPVQLPVCEQWQLGSLVTQEITEGSVVFLFASDFRGCGGMVELENYLDLRKILYGLSVSDFNVPICDLGNLIAGKTLKDSHFVIQEVVAACVAKSAIPVIIGGGMDFSYPLFAGVNARQQELSVLHICNRISLKNQGAKITEENYLGKLLSNKDFSLRDFHFLGYQRPLNEEDTVQLMKEVDFSIIRLAEMMNDTANMEPFFRKNHVAAVDCNAVESFSEPFSKKPQVNGLNRREICGYMKEIGIGEELKAVGIFNFENSTKNILNQQLFAQMLWYMLEGINIQRSHPKERSYETFLVLVDDTHYTFKRDTFSGLWYFGEEEEIENCVPCSKADYENAKRGNLNLRLLK